jgi:hypothetical protein
MSDDVVDNKVVKSLNTMKDRVYLTEGANISITTPNDSTINIAASGTGGASTLDQAYDGGGSGAGRVINADSGPVHIQRNDGLLVDGSVGIGISSPTQKLDINGITKMTGLQIPTNAQAGYVLTSSDANGNAIWQASSGGIGGSGTLNYLPKFTAATTLDTSMLYESFGRLGIGTTTTNNYKVTIDAGGTAGLGIKLHYASGLPRMLFKWDGATGTDAKAWEIRAGGGYFNISTIEDNDLTLISTPFTISRTGHVGIGNNDPLYPVDITLSGVANGIRVDHNGTTSGVARGVYVDLDNTGTTSTIYGVSSSTTQDAPSGAAYGLYGLASGSSTGDKYGVYGVATGTGHLYAGYFYGDVALEYGHLKSKQSTAPTIALSTAYYGGSASIENFSTDVAGKINFEVTTSTCGGCAIVTVTFNRSYTIAPIVTIMPTNAWAAIRLVDFEFFVNSSTTGFSVHSNASPANSNPLSFYYMVIEPNN